MDNFYKWIMKNHPANSKYKSIKFCWFVFALIFGTSSFLILALYDGLVVFCRDFYNEMADWFYSVKKFWFNIWK